MQVTKIEDGMRVEKNRVYLIPPRQNLKMFHGRLLLSEQERAEGHINLPIDLFFQSLAQDQGNKAIGIVLSGTGSDGTRGIRVIKERGGLIMAQSEESATFDSMPKNAIATGLVDYVLPPELMPQQLLAYIKHPFASNGQHAVIAENDNTLARIFSLLRDRHHVDFTHYKPNTIIRRIERRVTINQCHDFPEYVKLIESHPAEIKVLFQELLIGVTNFFRDPKVFSYLNEHLIPKLFQKSGQGDLRVWVAGCSTGEEAYTMAMLLAHYKDKIKSPIKIKIFATDVDQKAIEKAGQGIYPNSIIADVPAEYLTQYFIRNEETYRISRQIREMVVFSLHDLIKDPPFTNIDLITCRNLLIYLQPILQKKIIGYFNFSLNAQGILMLGSSESLGELEDLFDVVEPKFKLFISRGKQRLLGLAPQLTSSSRSWGTQDSPIIPRNSQENEHLKRFTEARFFNRLLQAFSEQGVIPLTLITNDRLEVTHIFGDGTGILRLPSGKVEYALNKLVVQELAVPMASVLHKSMKSGQPVTLTNIRLDSPINPGQVNVDIVPMLGKGLQETMMAVLVTRKNTSVQEKSAESVVYNVGMETQQRIADLEQELQFSRENLQATVEELETTNEELQTTNEELLASNEELQSTNEELQSVNEELYSVNAELQSKINELTVLNQDMDNLFNSTQIAALFLDESMAIRRFTPQLKYFFPIMESDIGRPITHLSLQMLDDVKLSPVCRIDLPDLIHTVIETHQVKEHEFYSNKFGWQLLRVTPYRTDTQEIAGVVLSVIDIDQIKCTQKALIEKTESANRAKTRFLSKMSHEIRTPLDAVIGLTYLLDSSALPTEERQIIDNIKSAGAAMMGVMNDILDLSKIESGEMLLESQTFNLSGLLDELQSQLGSSAHDDAVELSFAPLADDIPQILTGDPARLKQILLNLFNQALQLTTHGQVSLTVRYKESAESQIWLRFEVQDTGMGIPADQIPLLFTPLAQDQNATSSVYGSGLSLALTKQLIEQMEGNLGVESRVGKGSLFWMELPFTLDVKTTVESIQAPSRKLELVLMTDNADIEMYVKSVVERLEWHAEVVTTGVELIHEIKTREKSGQPLDCVLIHCKDNNFAEVYAINEWVKQMRLKRSPFALVLMTPFYQAQTPSDLNVDSLITDQVDSSILFNAVNNAIVHHTQNYEFVLSGTMLDELIFHWLHGLKVLLVDDSDLNLDVCQRILERQGAQVFTCKNGQQAIDWLEQATESVDAILMDIQMPVMDGNEATRHIRANPKTADIPIIALTAGALVSERDAALEAGVNDYLTKPINPARMIRTVRIQVERARASIIHVHPKPEVK